MGKYRYYYNPKTCRYERVRLTVGKVVWYSAGVFVVACLIFAGLIILSDRLTVTRLERTLIAENKALTFHHKILSEQLSDIEEKLTRLKDDDHTMHKRLFEDEIIAGTSSDHKHILLAEAGNFNLELDKLRLLSQKLLSSARSVNTAFGNALGLKKEEAIPIQSVPSLQPIANPDLDLLVSGFGMRINPFHKGKYFHPGIDFAAPKGTPVLATAPGKVITLKRSNLLAGYGNYIDIDHGNGFITRYAHLEDISVKRGQEISKGMTIGTVGNSGGSMAPHLHYEVIQDGTNVDPINYFVEGLNSDLYDQLYMISSAQNQSLD